MAYTPIKTLLRPEFDQAQHSYSFDGFALPGANSLMEMVGVKAPFDRTFWRQSLMRKGMTLEEAEEHMEERRVHGIERGKSVHAWIESKLKGEGKQSADFVPEHMDSIDGYCEGFREFIEEVSLSTVYLIEQPLVHPVCFYCGTVDCLAMTKHGMTVIDWKTTETISKFKKQPWQLYQQVLYGAAINRCYLLDEPVLQGMSVTLADDGYRVTRWETEPFNAAWRELKGLIYDFWEEQLEAGQMSNFPGVAPRALEAMIEAWGTAA